MLVISDRANCTVISREIRPLASIYPPLHLKKRALYILLVAGVSMLILTSFAPLYIVLV